MTVCKLVQSATGANHVSLVQFHGLGMYTVLAASEDAYGRQIMRRYRAVVGDDGALKHLRGM